MMITAKHAKTFSFSCFLLFFALPLSSFAGEEAASQPSSLPAPPKKPPMVIGPAVCGNSYVEISEECDDGNTFPGDGCREDCTLERCGDHVFDIGESCEECPEDCAFLPERVPEFPPKKRSPGVALSFSIAGTLASYGALTSGIVFAVKERPAGALLVLGSLGAAIAPGMGHIYAGEGPYAVRSAGFRLICAGLAGGAFALVFLTNEDIDELIGLGVIGTLGVLGSTAIDIVDAPAAARRAREGRSNPKRGPFPLSLGPLPSLNGTVGLGLFGAGRF